MCKPVTIDKYTCHSDKVRFVWDNATETDVAHYKKWIPKIFMKFNLRMLFIVVILNETLLTITTKVKISGDYVVPGFNEYAKRLYTEGRSCFLAWKSLGKPRAGLCYTDMCQSRFRFKGVLIKTLSAQ